jgi:hypothetical protein
MMPTDYTVTALVLFSTLFIAWYISSLRYEACLAKLGAKPRKLPYRLPLGFDTLWNAIQVSHSRKKLILVQQAAC